MIVRNTLSKILIFATGAAIGSVVTWKLINDKCDQRVKNELESMDEYYRTKYGVEEPEEEADEEIDEQMDIRQYSDLLGSSGYVDYTTANKSDEEEVDNVDRPYVIPPEELGELDGYETRTLYFHSDGVLTDDQGELIDDADDVVGEDFSEHYGEYEEDSVCVRNDAKRTDYEILYDPSTYRSGINKNPRLAEDE
jgi:hypothetical protein